MDLSVIYPYCRGIAENRQEYFSKAEIMNDEKYDVVVVGAGVSGLMTANFLKQKNKRVKVITREDVPGGKVKTFQYGGVAHAEARVYFFSDYSILFPLVKKFRLPMENLDAADNAYLKNGRLVYKTNRQLAAEKKSISALVHLVRYLAHRRRLLKAVETQSLSSAQMDELAMPFNSWAETHNYGFLSYVADRAFENVGFGSLDNEPVLYVLRMLSWGVFAAAMTGRIKNFPNTVTELLERLAEEQNVSYSTGFETMSRHGGSWKIQTSNGQLEANHVVFCCSPLQLDFSRYFGPDAQDIFTSESIHAKTFGVAMYEVADWFDHQTRGFLHNTGKDKSMLSAVRNGTLDTGNGSYTTFFYTGDKTTFGEKFRPAEQRTDLIDSIAADIEADGGKVINAFFYKEWPDFHTRFTRPAVATGRPLAFDNCNGQNNVWYVGSLNAHESFREISRASKRWTDKIAMAGSLSKPCPA